MEIVVSLADALAEAEVLALYRAHRWSAAEKPGQLMAALRNSHALVTARVAGRLVGLANAISDGPLVVYFPHLLVHPDVQRRGVGRRMMTCLLDQYRDFHVACHGIRSHNLDHSIQHSHARCHGDCPDGGH